MHRLEIKHDKFNRMPTSCGHYFLIFLIMNFNDKHMILF